MVLIDLIGQTFGKLTVVEKIRRDDVPDSQKIFWRCICSCMGREIEGCTGEAYVRGMSLRSGDTTSCGCNRVKSARQSRGESILGKVFGRLTVIGTERTLIGKRIRLKYSCKCSCPDGTIVLVDRGRLTCGRTQSCGCFAKDRVYLPIKIAATRHVLSTYKKNAITRKLEWGLSDTEATNLIETPLCTFCGKEPEERFLPRERTKRGYKLNGIDRLDSSIGYISGNCVACCSSCNYGKRDKSATDYIEHCRLVADNYPKVVSTI